MEKEVINVDGEDVAVRADTAKSYRGVIWALLSIGIIVLIGLILFFGFFSASVADGDQKNPAEVEQQRQ